MLARRIDTGRLGERVAVRYLERNGYRLLERNYRTREGEIDLIASRGTLLVFCEVKALRVSSRRASGPVRGPSHPLEGVGPAKRRQVRRIARAWLAEHRAARAPPAARDIRFDAIGVVLSNAGKVQRLEHVEGAF
jgi:putative endonuclease